MRFECTHCGKKYSSADDPTPGRVYVIGCKCGHSIVVKGPEKPHPAVATKPPSADPAPPVATHEAPAQRPRPSVIAPPPPSLELEAAGTAPFPDAGARRGRAGPSLDPFADVKDYSSPAGATPLADVPDIKGPIPEPTPTPRSFDPFAAQQGLLLDEDVAHAIQAEPAVRVEAGPDAGEVVTFSDQLPVAPPPRVPAPLPRRLERAPRTPSPGGRSIRLSTAVAAGAVALAAVVGASWFVFGRPSSTRPPAPAAGPSPAAPIAAPLPAPAAAAPHATAPIPAPAPPPPVAAVEPAPAAAPAPARAPPEREPPRRATAARAHRKAPAPEPVVAAAPAARQPAPPPPPPPAAAEPPREPAPRPKAAAAEPPAAPPAATAKQGGTLTPAEVEAAVRKNRKAFDACVEDAVRNEPALQVIGRRVGLYLTVNPSGIVTSPRLDDPELLDSELGACLKSTARTMVFPQFAGDPFQVKVPLILGRE